jgi:hypothetical protein
VLLSFFFSSPSIDNLVKCKILLLKKKKKEPLTFITIFLDFNHGLYLSFSLFSFSSLKKYFISLPQMYYIIYVIAGIWLFATCSVFGDNSTNLVSINYPIVNQMLNPSQLFMVQYTMNGVQESELLSNILAKHYSEVLITVFFLLNNQITKNFPTIPTQWMSYSAGQKRTTHNANPSNFSHSMALTRMLILEELKIRSTVIDGNYPIAIFLEDICLLNGLFP